MPHFLFFSFYTMPANLKWQEQHPASSVNFSSDVQSVLCHGTSLADTEGKTKNIKTMLQSG